MNLNHFMKYSPHCSAQKDLLRAALILVTCLIIQVPLLFAQTDIATEADSSSNANLQTTHVTSPYSGADKYINPDYALSIEKSIAQTSDPDLVAKMRTIQHTATAIWLDRIAAIYGGESNNGRSSLEEHLLRAVAQQRGNVPMLIELVIYNLPNRDCSALSSNGTLDFRSGGLEQYKNDYIDVIAKLLEEPRFASLRFAIMLEPDSLPNMVTNLWHAECAFVNKHDVYLQGIRYAIERFSQNANSYIYMDIGHSGWLGWESNLKATVQYFRKVVSGSKAREGLNAIDGFVTNISGSTPTEEFFLNDPNKSISGNPIKSADFYGWNQMLDEQDYIKALHNEFTQAGFSPDLKFLIDTSRNGWGGEERPGQPSTASTLKEYVDQSRIDRRLHRGNWCNPSGAGIGERPTSEPYGPEHPIAAFVWVKPPGESDGTSNPKQTSADHEGKRYDKMCDPDYIVSHGPTPSRKPTGALANAPASGHWFHDQFIMLIKNAHPVLEGNPSRK